MNEITERDIDLLRSIDEFKQIISKKNFKFMDTGLSRPGLPLKNDMEKEHYTYEQKCKLDILEKLFMKTTSEGGIILVKGQGNYETSRREYPMYHAFIAKCEIVIKNLDFDNEDIEKIKADKRKEKWPMIFLKNSWEKQA